MSGSITSSGKPPDHGDAGPAVWYAPALRAALEGGLAIASAGALAAWAFVGRRHLDDLWLALGAAWAAQTAGTFALAWGRGRSPAWFWRAFGAGIALRAGVFVALVASAWRRPWQDAGVLLGAYALGLTAVMLLELRHLVKDL